MTVEKEGQIVWHLFYFIRVNHWKDKHYNRIPTFLFVFDQLSIKVRIKQWYSYQGTRKKFEIIITHNNGVQNRHHRLQEFLKINSRYLEFCSKYGVFKKAAFEITDMSCRLKQLEIKISKTIILELTISNNKWLLLFTYRSPNNAKIKYSSMHLLSF